MVMRVLTIGGDAVSMTAASQIKRKLGDGVELVVLQQSAWTSYSACGIPYWVGGQVSGPEGLVARSPEQHRANGIDVRTRTRAEEIDVERGRVRAEARGEGGSTGWFDYDHLIIGTGARPKRPDVPGITLPGVQPIQTLDHGLAAIAALERRPRTAVVLGAGFIGVELVEAALGHGVETTIIDRAPEPMITMDPDIGALLHLAMTSHGVQVRMGEQLTELVPGPDGRVAAVRTGTGEYPADIVFLGLGVTPRSELAVAAGMPVGEFGGILTDPRQRVIGYENVWSGGDCTEVVDRLTDTRRHVPLGTHANKHGRVIGLNVSGGRATFPGIVGTALMKFMDHEVARVGLLESEGPRFGLDLRSVTISANTKAGYYPGSATMTVKMIGDRTTGRVMGCQIIGGSGAGKRIDAVATAIWNEMTAAQVLDLDLAYTPPFSPPWDPVQQAARQLVNVL